MLRNSASRWGGVAIALHWAFALLMLGQFALGWVAVEWRLSPTKLDLFVWHKSIGLVVLLLAVANMVWVVVSPPPALPATVPRWEYIAAKATQSALVVLMIALPVSGWVISSASNVPFKVFWLVPLPDITPVDRALEASAKQIHLWFFLAAAALVAFHIAGALRHHFVQRDDILARMVPLLRRRS